MDAHVDTSVQLTIPHRMAISGYTRDILREAFQQVPGANMGRHLMGRNVEYL